MLFFLDQNHSYDMCYYAMYVGQMLREDVRFWSRPTDKAKLRTTSVQDSPRLLIVASEQRHTVCVKLAPTLFELPKLIL